MHYNVSETKPGQLKITCGKTGLPYKRTNEFGMFCDGPGCTCEAESMQIRNNLGALIGMFNSGDMGSTNAHGLTEMRDAPSEEDVNFDLIRKLVNGLDR